MHMTSCTVLFIFEFTRITINTANAVIRHIIFSSKNRFSYLVYNSRLKYPEAAVISIS